MHALWACNCLLTSGSAVWRRSITRARGLIARISHIIWAQGIIRGARAPDAHAYLQVAMCSCLRLFALARTRLCPMSMGASRNGIA